MYFTTIWRCCRYCSYKTINEGVIWNYEYYSRRNKLYL